jgi:arsenate reductase
VTGPSRGSSPTPSPAAKKLHRDFEDPAALQGSEEQRLALFRRVRDELREYLKGFAQNLN